MLSIARFWLDLGVDRFRSDAVPYLVEREGTNCENLLNDESISVESASVESALTLSPFQNLWLHQN